MQIDFKKALPWDAKTCWFYCFLVLGLIFSNCKRVPDSLSSAEEPARAVTESASGETDPVPYSFAAVEVPPQPIGGVAAIYQEVVYPAEAAEQGVDGLAQVQFVVGSDGRARDFEILAEHPEGAGFGPAAVDALSRVTFIPGMQDGEGVAVSMVQVIRFEPTP